MNTNQKTALFTFDYELFLGKKSGSVEECLIYPTQKILAIFKKYKVKGIFFIDTTYLIRLKEIKDAYPQASRDFDRIVDQIMDMFKLGHEVFPHIHPHWIDAVYLPETNEWDLSNFSKYRFNSLTIEEREELWEESTNLLKEITNSDLYQCDGYRAGGWSIQPFDDFKPYFVKYGIKYEFSVVPGKYLSSEAHSYDFSLAPEIPFYQFSNDVCQELIDGIFVEFPISNYDLGNMWKLESYFSKIGFYFRMILSYFRPSKGSTVNPKVFVQGYKTNNTNQSYQLAQFEGTNIFKIYGLIRKLRKTSYLHSLSHPKCISNFDLFALRIFCCTFNRNSNCNTDFRTMIK